jgi:hypothetical protein
MPRRAGASAILGLWLVLQPAGAAADTARDQSRAAFMRGVADAHQGHYTAARDAFIEAYTLFAHPSILLNLGIARWHTGEYIQAEKDLARFLSDDGGASDEDIANARAGLAAVRQHLGTVRMRIAPDGARAALDDQPVALVPGAFAEVRAVVGPTVLRVEADGYEAARQTLLVTHETPTTVDLALKPLAGTGPGPAKEGPETPPPDDGTRKVIGYAAVGVAAASAVVWGVTGIRALLLANQYNTRGSTDFQNPSTKATGMTFRTTADVFFGVTLVSGGVGAYLLVFPLKKDTTPATTSLLVGPASLGLSGTF